MNENFSISFIEQIENELVISHKVLAKQTENKEKSVLDLITRNLPELEEFGMVRFKIVAIKNAKNKVNEEKTYYLNEPQATLILTFMRNNEIVKQFKIKLIKEFFKMREILKSKTSQPTQPIQTQAPQTFDNFDFAKQTQQNREILDFIELINSQSPINLFFLEKIYKYFQVKSPLKLLGIDLNSYYFIPTELGKFLNKSAVEINKILEAKGFQIKVNGVWQLTENGEKYAIQLDNSYKTIKWKLEVIL
jgi:phage regulator Rha-like protein